MRLSQSKTQHHLAAVVCCVAAACGATRIEPERAAVAPAAPAVEPANPWADDAREVLVQHCGSCHRSTLSTAKPGALAVFDLDQGHWYWRMHDEQIAELARRIGATTGITSIDKGSVADFAACELEHRCNRD